jgi:hypothetical protein
VDEITRNRYPAVDWKADLRVTRREFTEYERFSQGTSSVCNAVERYLIHSAVAIRKLLVQRKLTDEVTEADRPVLSYPCTKRPEKRWWFEGIVDLENHHHFVRHYDMERPRKESLRLKRLADLLIHSFVFAVWPADGGTFEDARVFFNSDQNQDRVVYEIQVAAFSAIVEEVVDDEIVWRSYDQTTDEFEQHNWLWKREQREAQEAWVRKHRESEAAQVDAAAAG